GTGGAGGSGQTGTPPGDIAMAAGTPMVAAHSLTRAMYAAYSGKLFQVQRKSDNKTQDISPATTGGLVDLNTLNTFCSGTTCTVARLYDQAGNGNDMWQTAVASQPTVGFWTAGNGTKYPMAVSAGYQWLRNRNMTKKIPTGSNPQTEYFVVHGAYAGRAAGTNGCCYDYGNMENHIGDDGPGTMTAMYFGNATDWTRGAGNGPWVMLDMENGVFAGGGSIAILNAGNASVNANDPSLSYPGLNIVTGLAKTDGKMNFEIKYGNASTGGLSIAWNGSLPTNKNPTSYIPLQQQGGISLGEGGDGSAMGTGAFSEGCIIAAQTSDATDDAIQANLTTLYK
ncbi:MAG TPA: arabinofuranosidase catalytic domain-containing protein, partial [Polyangia bacterium]|nr:arabinofuranosidase catalytic domain-containing protein [Polyangia bacterium]